MNTIMKSGFGFFKVLLLLGLMGPTLPSYGQAGGAGNGGDVDEAYVIGAATGIGVFLGTSVGRAVFPEIDPVKFMSIVENTDVQIVDRRLRDSQRYQRTGLNFRLENSYLIRIQRKAIDRAYSREGSVGVMVFVFHEFLNLYGLELPEADGPPSIYDYSRRIAPFASEILKGNASVFDENQYGCAAYVSFSLARSLEINRMMLSAQFKISDLGQSSTLFKESKIDAGVACQKCGEELRCELKQGASSTARQILQQQLQHQYQVQQQQMQQQQESSHVLYATTQRSSHSVGQVQASIAPAQGPVLPTVLLSDLDAQEVWRLFRIKKFATSAAGACQQIHAQLTCTSLQKGIRCFSYQF